MYSNNIALFTFITLATRVVASPIPLLGLTTVSDGKEQGGKKDASFLYPANDHQLDEVLNLYGALSNTSDASTLVARTIPFLARRAHSKQILRRVLALHVRTMPMEGDSLFGSESSGGSPFSFATTGGNGDGSMGAPLLAGAPNDAGLGGLGALGGGSGDESDVGSNGVSDLLAPMPLASTPSALERILSSSPSPSPSKKSRPFFAEGANPATTINAARPTTTFSPVIDRHTAHKSSTSTQLVRVATKSEDKKCHVTNQRCCGKLTSHHDPATRDIIGGFLGVSDDDSLVGLQCLANISGQSNCTPACCTGEEHNGGLVSFGCIQILL